MKKSLLAVFLALAFGLPASADLKIAVVDSAQVFDAFYKTQEMAKRIATKKAGYEKEIQAVQAEDAHALQDAQALEARVKDTSIPLDARHESDAALVKKMEEIKAIEGELEQMRKSRSEDILGDIDNGHRDIADEITRSIAAYGTAQGYDLILDKAEAARLVYMIFPNSAQNVVDITAEVISKLNASAPPQQAAH